MRGRHNRTLHRKNRQAARAEHDEPIDSTPGNPSLRLQRGLGGLSACLSTLPYRLFSPAVSCFISAMTLLIERAKACAPTGCVTPLNASSAVPGVFCIQMNESLPTYKAIFCNTSLDSVPACHGCASIPAALNFSLINECFAFLTESCNASVVYEQVHDWIHAVLARGNDGDVNSVAEACLKNVIGNDLGFDSEADCHATHIFKILGIALLVIVVACCCSVMEASCKERSDHSYRPG